MDKELLRQVQLVQLEMVKDIKKICEDNNIDYFMDSGTLLGAVRHKGFIPWDDDMDIGMTRTNYEKFLMIAPQYFGDKYFLQTWKSDPFYPFPFAKIRKIGTVYKEAGAQFSEARCELFVDVFPYDYLPNDNENRKKQKIDISVNSSALLMKCHYTPWMNLKGIRRLYVFLKYRRSAFVAKFHTKEELINSCYEAMIRFNDSPNRSRDLFPEAGIVFYDYWNIPVDCFEKYIQLSFEDTSFAAPIGYEKYLTIAYGNYNELPPEKERYNRHNILELKI